MTKEEKSNLIEKYLDSYNTFDIQSKLSVLHDDIEFKNISDSKITVQTKGIKDFEKLAQQSKNIFSMRKQTITDIIWESEKVIAAIDYEGLLAMDLPNGLKTGEILRLKGFSEFTFHDNKIFSITDIS